MLKVIPSRLPLAGLCSFAVHIAFAAMLAGPMQGAGITLTLASAVNTVLLFCFLRNKPWIALGKVLATASMYTLKLSLFSGIAVLPVNPFLSAWCASRGRLVVYGVPLLITGLGYAMLGVLLLRISKDRHIQGIGMALIGFGKKPRG